jgi:hypothetical protein
MKTRWKFYEKKIKKWFSWLVLIHVRIGGQFSIQFSHVMVSIGFHMKTKLRIKLIRMTIRKLCNTRNNLLGTTGENSLPYKDTTIRCNSCSRRTCYNLVTCMFYLLLKSKDVQVRFKPKEKQDIMKHIHFKVKLSWNWFQRVGIFIIRFFLAPPNHLSIKKGGISLLHIIVEAYNKFTQFE